MSTKVFISWSGELSKRFAEALRGWLPSALQHVKPYFSPDDIDKGAKWDREISQELDESQVGIICLTRENLKREWVLYETGALSKNVDKSNVCPIVLDLGTSDIEGPLSCFQITELTKPDFKRLFKTINKASGDRALEPDVLNSVFEKWWPDFEKQINELLSNADVEDIEEEPFKSDREVLDEVLRLVRAKNVKLIDDFRQKEDAADALRDLVVELHDIWSLFEGTNEEYIHRNFERIKRPLRILTGIVGRDDLYMHYKHNIGSLCDDE